MQCTFYSSLIYTLQEFFYTLPHNRRLTPGELKDVQNLLSLKANKKMVKDKIEKTSGKKVTLKDLSNISTKQKSTSTRNDLKETVFIHVGACVDVIVDNDNVLQGIFFQDNEMKHSFTCNPELLCIDATYKLLELRFPLFLMLIEDVNWQSIFVASFLALNETEASFS